MPSVKGYGIFFRRRLMNTLIKKVPIPLAGLMLAAAATGNLVLSYGSAYKNIFGLISFALLILVLAKIIIHPDMTHEDLKNPLIASVFPTLTMGLILLSAYIRPFLSGLAFGLWIIGLVGHAFLIISFSLKHLMSFDSKKVFPSWFIVYVGIVAGSVTAPVFGMQTLGRILFWFGLIAYFLVLPLVIRRLKSLPMPEPAQPSIAIFAAPLALCLAGYISSFEAKNISLVYGLLIASQLSYIFVLLKLPKLLRLKFYPSFSSFTFPLVISAISLKLTNGFLLKADKALPGLGYLVKFEEALAIAIVLYVLLKFLSFLFELEGKKLPA